MGERKAIGKGFCCALVMRCALTAHTSGHAVTRERGSCGWHCRDVSPSGHGVGVGEWGGAGYSANNADRDELRP